MTPEPNCGSTGSGRQVREIGHAYDSITVDLIIFHVVAATPLKIKIRVIHKIKRRAPDVRMNQVSWRRCKLLHCRIKN